MKRALLTSILGIATSATVACGQGFVALDNYSSAISPLITYSFGFGGPLGQGISGAQWTVGLYFGQGTFVAADPSDPRLALGTGPGSTAPLVAPGIFISAGNFQATTDAVPGSVTFMVVAYDGAGYESSLFYGHSDSFTVTPKVGIEFPPYLGDYMTTFSVPVLLPEPSTFTLAGMGVVALLIARRRQLT